MAFEYKLGHNLRIFLDNVGIFNAKSCQVKVTRETSEISDKDVNPGSTAPPVKVRIPKAISADGTCTAYVTEEAQSMYKSNIDLLLDGSTFTIRYTTNETGDTFVEFDAIITEWSSTADDASEAEYSITFVSVGPITTGNVT